jgi:hypothetical protein
MPSRQRRLLHPNDNPRPSYYPTEDDAYSTFYSVCLAVYIREDERSSPGHSHCLKRRDAEHAELESWTVMPYLSNLTVSERDYAVHQIS